MNIITFIIGLAIGMIVILIAGWLKKRESEQLTQRLKDTFAGLSLDALAKNTEQFLNLADQTLKTQTQSGAQELEGKKKLIDQTLELIRTEMQKVQDSIGGLEKDRAQKFGELANQLKATENSHLKLQKTTEQLTNALASTKTRGQWGERMAEDVLRLAGFIEGINYRKQKSLESVNTRPDYTFFLPHDLKVNMDVKFPLDNYLRYLETPDDCSRDNYKIQFLKDVRDRIKEVTTRDYINPAEQTVDYVIVFIPNEQVYGFINENDRAVLDDALKNKVILCSPLTLYAILAIIRQSVDNFHFEKGLSKILSLMQDFKKQYRTFIESLTKVGKKIDEAQQEFNNLTSTRRKQLERPLRQIDELSQQKGISENLSAAEGNLLTDGTITENNEP